MRATLRVIDSISEWTGKIIRWLCVVLVGVVVYGVILRYVFNSPTMWAYETSIMLGTTIYVLGWAYVHRHGGHIRVDVFYMRLSLRGRAIIDVVGDLLCCFPLIILLIYISAVWAGQAWSINEKMILTYWYPPAAPVRTIVVIGFCLLLFQGGAQFIRDLYQLIRNKPYD